jgi:hypothetical protein
MSKVYMTPEAAVTWRNSGGTELFTCTSLGASAGRQGALHDFGTSARARRFTWRAWLKPGATRVVDEPIFLYLKTSDGSHPDNDDGTGDIAVSAENKLKNLGPPIGVIRIDEDAAVEMAASGEIEMSHRYACPVMWNDSANALSSTAADFGFDMTPVPDEIQ